MNSDWTDIKQTDKYSNMFQPGSYFDHVHAVGDAREFIQTYAKALLKRANQYIWGLAVGLGAMLVVTVLAFASGSILEIDEFTLEIVSFIFSIIWFMMLKKLFTNCNNKKLAKKILDPSLLNELSDEEIIRRANDAIDIYNRQMAVSYQEEEEPQHKSLSDQETGDEDRVQNTEYSNNKQKEKQTVMLNGVPVELNDGNSMNGKRGKRRNSTLSRGQIGLIIGVITAILFVGAVVVEQNPSNQDITEDFYYTEYDTSEDQETEETPVPISDDAEKALETAKTYAQLDMSKDMIYDKLIHGPGSFFTNYERFTDAAAQYAVDHLECDWNENAVGAAEAIDRFEYYSEATMREDLIENGGFTEESADYAIEHASIDWNENALERAKSYKRWYVENDMIYEFLTGDTERFTPEQAQYAIDHLEET